MDSINSAIKANHNNTSANKHHLVHKGRTVSHFAGYTTNKYSCVLCKKNHLLFQCSQFLALTVTDRKNFAKNNKLCFNCLRTGHQISACKSTNLCKECNHKHHSLLHQVEDFQQPEIVPSTSSVNVTQSGVNHSVVLLSTAIVLIKDSFNRMRKCRALLDMRSQSHFITESMVKKLGLNSENTNLTILGVNSVITTVKKQVNVNFHSTYTAFSSNINCFVVPQVITNLPM